MKQEFNNYTSSDHKVWQTLFSRQIENLQNKACKEYLSALNEMKEALNPSKIANFNDLNKYFNERTKWNIQCVPGLIPVDEFFELLAQKKFCSSTWLRTPENLDYLEEPDMFHDIFGHIPLLSDDTYSAFIHEFGKLGMSIINNKEKLLMLQRLYWFSIEFGLIQQNGVKIYGAGILSSYGESIECLSTKVTTKTFDIDEIIQKEFHTDQIQTEYYIIDSFEQLFHSLETLINNWNHHAVERN